MTIRKLIAGNWKMNGSLGMLHELDGIAKATFNHPELDVVICPSFTLIAPAIVRQPDMTFGAQDCHYDESGSHTGCVSAPMLREVGASYVIVGHSERRIEQNETNEEIRAKTTTAIANGLVTIVCIGESRAAHASGQALPIIGAQLDGCIPPDATSDNLVVAYEPIWAIGTGNTPPPDSIAEMHASIRDRLCLLLGSEGKKVRILYGGSVTGKNAEELMAIPDVNGTLVGGASLTAEQFVPIIEAGGRLA
ncbi:triose-phosphate isomerase [Zymomonas mobilis]|uniref:triose-phosphate isomerase n=1 Tax=Zymomonas mobilis TaxID=542 RepID=UPI0039ECA245